MSVWSGRETPTAYRPPAQVARNEPFAKRTNVTVVLFFHGFLGVKANNPNGVAVLAWRVAGTPLGFETSRQLSQGRRSRLAPTPLLGWRPERPWRSSRQVTHNPLRLDWALYCAAPDSASDDNTNGFAEFVST